MDNRVLNYLVRRAAPVGASVLIALAAPHVRAQQLGVQAQTEYDFEQLKLRNGDTRGRGFLSVNYNLTLRRRFVPSSTLLSDLSINGADNAGTSGSQNARGWTLNLLSEQSRYLLTGRVLRNNFNSSFGPGVTSRGSSTFYNAGIYLRQPAWPVVSLQFQRNAAEAEFEGSSSTNTATTYLSSIAYSLAPIRLSYDRTQQNISATASPGSRVTSQTSSITLDQALLQGLSIFGELSASNTDVSFGAGSTSAKTGRRVLRLTATPTRSVVAEVDLTSQNNNQRVALSRGHTGSNELNWSVRSEILPGLSLDIEDQRQRLTGGGFLSGLGTVIRNRNIALSARLPKNSIVSASASRVGYDSALESGDVSQKLWQASMQTSLTRSTDLTLNYLKTTSLTGLSDRFYNVSQGVSIRDRRSAKISVGAAYRRVRIRSLATTDSFDQHGDAVDLDILAQPGYVVSLGLRLSYQNNKGSSPYKSVAPGANLRWQVDSRTSVTANWNSQRYRQYDPAARLSFGQDTRGLSARLTHSFVNGAYLDISYDFQGNSVSDVQWRRILRVGFTVNR